MSASPAPGKSASPNRQIRPARAAVGALLRTAPQLRPRVEKLMWRGVYEAASLGRRELGAALMNYGYADAADTAAAVGDAGEDQYGLALYEVVAAGADLTGADVLEPGCGRGGGAAHVFAHHGPRSLVGLDLAASAIRRARRRYARPGLTFRVGDAERLPLPRSCVDAVISVESTHCYPDAVRFLGEAHRVLRPGGTLLLADFRETSEVAAWRAQLRAARFGVVAEEEITGAVVRALTLNTPRMRARLERRVPGPLRRHALQFAAVEGSAVHRAFAEGALTYLRFVLVAG